MFHRQADSKCVPSLRLMLKGRPVCQYSLVDVKDPMVSFMKSRRAISGTMNKFKISVLTYRGHCISGTVVLPGMMQPRSLVLHKN